MTPLSIMGIEQSRRRWSLESSASGVSLQLACGRLESYLHCRKEVIVDADDEYPRDTRSKVDDMSVRCILVEVEANLGAEFEREVHPVRRLYPFFLYSDLAVVDKSHHVPITLLRQMA